MKLTLTHGLLGITLLALASCGVSEQEKADPTGVLTRFEPSPAELSTIHRNIREGFGQADWRKPAGVGAASGSFLTSQVSISDYQVAGEVRAIRGPADDLVIVPYTAKVATEAGNGSLRSYITAIRRRETNNWVYDDGFSENQRALFQKFPGLKKTNALPSVRIMLDGNPRLNRG